MNQTRAHRSKTNNFINFYCIKINESERGAMKKLASMSQVPHTAVKGIAINGGQVRKIMKDAGISSIIHPDTMERIIHDSYKQNLDSTVRLLHQKVANDRNINCSESTLRTFWLNKGFHNHLINK